jgi:nitrite reductase/ring-hydroxylating ferredoxin subunit
LGGYFARTEASRSYALAVLVEGDRPPDMYINVDTPTRSLRTAGDHLIVGGEGHRVGEGDDTDVHYRNLETWARQHFRVTSVEHRWSAQDWRSADGIPYIGRMAGHGDGVYVATAFRKWGMTHGTIAGLLIRDLINGRDNPWLAVYDASRLAPRQSVKRVVTENVGVVRHLIGDRIQSRRAHDLDDLQPNESIVATVDGKAVAAFRDEAGTVHTVSAVCTHLGCLVQFNSAERSWDCPCHGSRFSLDGTVLEGPATQDLPGRDA